MELNNKFGGQFDGKFGTQFGEQPDDQVDSGIQPVTVTEPESVTVTVTEASPAPEAQPDVTPSKLLTGSPCGICGSEQAAIRINVDGNTLLMESCDGCDVRRWQLAGERIDLQEALNQVGEHSGRRR
ncbi:MAG: hypothetical protein ACRBK7_26700 [Acidimicrobiales bacterium]